MKIKFVIKEAKRFDKFKDLIIKAAQEVYDHWDQNEEGHDETYGNGGICDDIAAKIANVINDNTPYEATTFYNEYNCHTSVYVADKENEILWNIDIHPSYYENGTAYTWRQIKDVIFDRSMIDITQEEYDQFIDEDGE